MKPCARCRTRNLTCEYASSEAGSAAAMHLLHLSATGRSHSDSPQPLSQPQVKTEVTTPTVVAAPQLGHDASPQSYNRTHIQHTLPPPQVHVTNPQAPVVSPVLTSNPPPVNSEEAQLPTPETMVDHSMSLPLSYLSLPANQGEPLQDPCCFIDCSQTCTPCRRVNYSCLMVPCSTIWRIISCLGVWICAVTQIV